MLLLALGERLTVQHRFGGYGLELLLQLLIGACGGRVSLLRLELGHCHGGRLSLWGAAFLERADRRLERSIGAGGRNAENGRPAKSGVSRSARQDDRRWELGVVLSPGTHGE